MPHKPQSQSGCKTTLFLLKSDMKQLFSVHTPTPDFIPKNDACCKFWVSGSGQNCRWSGHKKEAALIGVIRAASSVKGAVTYFPAFAVSSAW